MAYIYIFLIFNLICAPKALATESYLGNSLEEAIKSSKSLSSIRLRYEGADEESLTKNSNAITNRMLLGFETGTFKQFKVGIQVLNVTALHDDYNSFKKGASERGKSEYPRIIDPEITDINQLYIDYLFDENDAGKIRFGRQSYKLDNTRFIGNLDIRQSMQVFDGISLEKKIEILGLTAKAAHFSNVRLPTTKYENINTNLINLTKSIDDFNKLTLYGYWIDFDELTSKSNRTLGGLLKGTLPLKDNSMINYQLELADQISLDNSSPQDNSKYYRYSLGVEKDNWSVRYENENLGAANHHKSFQTPFGMYRLFQGWSDRFTSTPEYGINDQKIIATSKLGTIQFQGEYHNLRSDRAFQNTDGRMTSNYGEEFDLGVRYPYNNLEFSFQYAHFKEAQKISESIKSGRKPDLSRLWLTVFFPF